MRRIVNALVITVLLLEACEHKQHKESRTAVKVNNVCDSCCLNKLAQFANNLSIKSSENFACKFDEKHFSLGNCELKKYRGNASLKSSLVLIWLKIDQVYLKNNRPYAYIQDIAGNSKAAYQIVFEFYFLTTGESPRWIEYMEAAWVNKLIESDSSLRKDEQIKLIYNQNRLLKTRKLKKARHTNHKDFSFIRNK